MSNDLFLEADGVRTEADALTESLKAALQRNKVYSPAAGDDQRAHFRTEWAKLLRHESAPYALPTQPILDVQHCAAIQRIVEDLSSRFGECLHNGRLRYGTSQKAFNLYLKYLWRLNLAATPPHCPVDAIVLAEAHLAGSWTKSDSENEYLQWIHALRMVARPRSLAEWEYEIWLREALKQRSAASSRGC